jgi:hypothetical protein
MKIEGSWQVIDVAKLAKIPVIIHDSREFGRESGLLWTASTASKSWLLIINNLTLNVPLNLPQSRISFSNQRIS